MRCDSACNIAPACQDALYRDLLQLLGEMNRGGESLLVIPGEYMEVVVTKR